MFMIRVPHLSLLALSVRIALTPMCLVHRIAVRRCAVHALLSSMYRVSGTTIALPISHLWETRDNLRRDLQTRRGFAKVDVAEIGQGPRGQACCVP